ncbi:hypothetical protein FGG08_004289 [Glutinoglossum americanum]|uniref:DUF7605 domain-containing protein n=1 Tax=Glutinoglossum americanum TaxID=1670608 RepID=A0A9P8I0Y4_9PEZI|nr:hypothetical protein FGG08_004289 [Glutinoglossum americanum]
MGDREIHELLDELLWSRHQLYIDDTKVTAVLEQFKKYERQSAIAWHALSTAFGEKLPREYPKDREGGSYTSTASTATECCDETATFAKDNLRSFTKVIRVYLETELLNTGVVLADLPGFHDTNLARSKIVNVDTTKQELHNTNEDLYSEVTVLEKKMQSSESQEEYQQTERDKEDLYYNLTDDTGITNPRRYSRSIPAEAQFKAALQLLGNQIPALLHSLELWLSRPTVMEPGYVGNAIEEKLDHLIEQLSELISRKKEKVELQLVKKIIATFVQYPPMCRNNGTHSTDRMPLGRWNLEIMDMPINDTIIKWEEPENEIYHLFVQLRKETKQETQESAASILGIDPAPQLKTPKTPREKRLHRHHIQAQPGEDRILPRSGQGGVLPGVATGDHVGSYIVAEMLSTYCQNAQEHGTGYSDRQRATVRSHLYSSSPSLNISNRIQLDFTKLPEDVYDQIRDHTTAVTEKLGGDARMLERERGSTTNMVDSARREMEAMRRDIEFVKLLTGY